MQDSEKHHPLRSSAHNNGHTSDDEMQVMTNASEESESDFEQESNGTTAIALPQNGFLYALIAGIIAGVLCFLLQVAITILNGPTFQRAASEGVNITYNTALAVFGLQCLDFLLSLLICFVAGFVVGRIAVQRRLGFLAGALAGAIVYLGGFLVNFIPGYPGTFAGNAPAGAGMAVAGLFISLVFLLIWGVIGGLMSLWGAWAATRRHPYYFVS